MPPQTEFLVAVIAFVAVVSIIIVSTLYEYEREGHVRDVDVLKAGVWSDTQLPVRPKGVPPYYLEDPMVYMGYTPNQLHMIPSVVESVCQIDANADVAIVGGSRGGLTMLVTALIYGHNRNRDRNLEKGTNLKTAPAADFGSSIEVVMVDRFTGAPFRPAFFHSDSEQDLFEMEHKAGEGNPAASKGAVRSLLSRHAIPQETLSLHERLDDLGMWNFRKFRLLIIDTGYYETTLKALNKFGPKMIRDGIIVIMRTDRHSVQQAVSTYLYSEQKDVSGSVVVHQLSMLRKSEESPGWFWRV